MKITLKAARVNAGLLQKEVADKLGVSIHTIINWERGITKPKKHTLMVLASIYNIDINELKGVNTILTTEQRKIAEENHNLIYFFINYFKVDEEEYYDLFAIDYLKCIKVWDKSKGNLSTLLGRAFSNRIKAENRKKKAKKRFEEGYMLSLNEVVFKEASDLTLGDTIQSSINVEETFELNEALNFLWKMK